MRYSFTSLINTCFFVRTVYKGNYDVENFSTHSTIVGIQKIEKNTAVWIHVIVQRAVFLTLQK